LNAIMKNFRDLEVWRLSHELVLRIYRLTSAFPHEEQFSLTSQARRAAVSIPANIAEGCGRGSNRDFSRFLQIAAGSASELEYHLLLSRDLGFLSAPDYESVTSHAVRAKKMLSALIRKVKADS
jgi:four helix bundle protein